MLCIDGWNHSRSIAAEGKPVNGLFRLLASPVIWEMAYASIRTNKGALLRAWTG